MMKPIGRKEIQRRRKMRHFIDAADQIITEKGVDALTIRGVSNIAGYNSATLYNYFSNVDHLIYYTHMKHIPEFDGILRPVYQMEGDSSDLMELMWREFCKLAYQNIEVVYTFMFSPFSGEFNEILKDYFNIYRERFDASEDDEMNILFENSIFDVVVHKLKTFESEAKLDPQDMDELNSFILTYFQGHLARRMTVDSDVSFDDYLNRMVRFMEHIIWSYTIKNK
jgi:AcrR family transcriptional regulator